MTLKQQLRQQIKEQMKEFQDNGSSQILCERLKETEEWKSAKNILLYFPLQGEVNLLNLLKDSEKNFYFPKVVLDQLELFLVRSESDLEKGSFDILEPKKDCQKLENLHLLDLIIVPGLAFDKNGGRLGRGKGFYDKFLSQLTCKTVSLAFPFQIVDQVPVEEHDIRIGKVIY